MGDVGEQGDWNSPIRLLGGHLPDLGCIGKCLLAAGGAALEQAVVALGIEQALLSNPAFWKQWLTFAVMTK